MSSTPHIHTLGGLKASGYQPRSVKEELRSNLIEKIQAKENVFPGIYGFDDTVLPDVERAILSRHNILLLGLRGQAKNPYRTHVGRACWTSTFPLSPEVS